MSNFPMLVTKISNKEIIGKKMNKINKELLFHKITITEKKYQNIEINVDIFYNLKEKAFDNEDCYFYFEMNKKKAEKKYKKEIKKINKWLIKNSKIFGFKEICNTGKVVFNSTKTRIA